MSSQSRNWKWSTEPDSNAIDDFNKDFSSTLGYPEGLPYTNSERNTKTQINANASALIRMEVISENAPKKVRGGATLVFALMLSVDIFIFVCMTVAALF